MKALKNEIYNTYYKNSKWIACSFLNLIYIYDKIWHSHMEMNISDKTTDNNVAISIYIY